MPFFSSSLQEMTVIDSCYLLGSNGQDQLIVL